MRCSNLHYVMDGSMAPFAINGRNFREKGLLSSELPQPKRARMELHPSKTLSSNIRVKKVVVLIHREKELLGRFRGGDPQSSSRLGSSLGDCRQVLPGEEEPRPSPVRLVVVQICNQTRQTRFGHDAVFLQRQLCLLLNFGRSLEPDIATDNVCNISSASQCSTAH